MARQLKCAFPDSLNAGACGSLQQRASTEMPTRWGKFRALAFERDFKRGERILRESAIVLIMGNVKTDPPLVRVHSQCLTGDALGSLRCDCGLQLQQSLAMIAAEGRGALIYEEQEGRGIGLIAKLQAYELQDEGCDTIEANSRLGLKNDYRSFDMAGDILKALGITRVRLITNNPGKITALQRRGIEVMERVSCQADPGPTAAAYIKTKQEKLGHLR
jgi:GTP cyclohydrolase II